MSNEKHVIAVSMKTKRPGCVIIQAAMGGSTASLNKFFGAEHWQVDGLSEMKLIEAPEEDWRKLRNLLDARTP